ncbi:MAG: hypothetical protein ACI9XO_002497, partial [Paraglaciecola sp.]
FFIFVLWQLGQYIYISFECGYYKVMNLSSLSFFKALHLIHRQKYYKLFFTPMSSPNDALQMMSSELVVK